jgi:hypothetical protein
MKIIYAILCLFVLLPFVEDGELAHESFRGQAMIEGGDSVRLTFDSYVTTNDWFMVVSYGADSLAGTLPILPVTWYSWDSTSVTIYGEAGRKVVYLRQ